MSKHPQMYNGIDISTQTTIEEIMALTCNDRNRCLYQLDNKEKGKMVRRKSFLQTEPGYFQFYGRTYAYLPKVVAKKWGLITPDSSSARLCQVVQTGNKFALEVMQDKCIEKVHKDMVKFENGLGYDFD